MLDSLREFNPWWSTGQVNYKKEILLKRGELQEIIDQLDEEMFTLLVGPRRIGKSTLFLNTIEHLIKLGVNPLNILFLSVENSKLVRLGENISEIIDFYIKEVLSTANSFLLDKIYIFIDDIHTIKGWHPLVKNYHEKYKKIKFILSCSSPVHLFDNPKESLLERYQMVKIFPLDLWEFAAHKNKYSKLLAEDDFSKLLSLMPTCNLIEEPVGYFESLKRNHLQLSFFEIKFTSFVNEYLLAGGYLEYFSQRDASDWTSKLLDIAYYTLYKDIIVSFDASSGKILYNLFRYVVENSGDFFSYNEIGKALGISPVTVASYLRFLEKSHLIMIQELISEDSMIKIKSNKKIQIVDNGIKNAIEGVDILSDARKSSCYITAVISYINNICKKNNWILSYKDKNETDVIVNKDHSSLSIKLDFIDKFSLKDFQTMKTSDNDEISIVVTKSILERDNNKLYLPFWMIK